MSEHTPMDPFETRLTALARSYTEPAVRSIDPLATARAAMASTTRGSVLGRLWPVGLDRRVAWLLVLAALVIAIAALAVAIGSQTPTGLGRIVFVRDGDVFVAEVDGSGQTRIATGGANGAKFGYLTTLWAPDGRHIAAARDSGGEFLTPAVDLLTADGALVRTVELGPGGTPSVTWSPDGSGIAIVAYAADVPRDAIEPIVGSEVRLLVFGLDASADREIELPPDWRGFATSDPEIWTVPDFGAMWSRDGRWIALRAGMAIAPEQTFAWHTVAVDGSGTRPGADLIDGLVARVDSLDWSPDRRRLAISGDWVGCMEEVCLGIVDSEGGRVTSTVVHPASGDSNLHGKLFFPEFSPDGDRVAVLGLLIDFTSEPAVAETYTLYDYDLATARLVELTSGIRSMILDATGAAHPTGTVAGELVAGATVAWTPDGRRLLYLVREAGDAAASWTIRSIDAAGGNQSSVLVRGVQSFDIGFSD